jgi:hypothetical protein
MNELEQLADLAGQSAAQLLPKEPAIASLKENPNYKKITEADFEEGARYLDCEIAAIKAVFDIESNGSGFYPSGLPVILFERHWFYDKSDQRDSLFATHSDICNPTPGGYLGGLREWNRLDDAVKLDRTAALLSASYGLGQVMGFNHEICGYENIEGFVIAMFESEWLQFKAMLDYCKNLGLDAALREQRWADFAFGYNGEDYAINAYDVKLANAYASYA